MELRSLVVGSAATFVVGVGVFAAASTFQPAPAPRAWLCASEGVDVGPCVWDAQSQGNGQGRSFYLDAEGNVTPLP